MQLETHYLKALKTLSGLPSVDIFYQGTDVNRYVLYCKLYSFLSKKQVCNGHNNYNDVYQLSTIYMRTNVEHSRRRSQKPTNDIVLKAQLANYYFPKWKPIPISITC